MKTVGILPNSDRDTGLEFTKKLLDWLIGNGIKPLLTQDVANELGCKEYATEKDDIFKYSDFLAVLGGDGTILRAAKTAAVYDTPLIGINLGRLGYLTDVEKSGAFDSLTRVFQGNYKIEKRLMVQVSHTTENSTDVPMNPRIALNDVCISKGISSKMITINLKFNGEYVDTYRSDGIIISTPTGSTAYNLSAGGPVLKPDMEIMAITLICPHMLYTRPSVVSAEDVISIEVLENPYNDSRLALDGENTNHLKNGDIITIRRSEYYTRIIKTQDQGFYNILRQKLVD